MELFDNLAAHGLPISTLQVLIIGGAAIFLIGMYWQVIVAGAAIAFCVAVFAMPSQASKVERINPADVAPTEFIEDCMHYNTNATKQSCQQDWKEQGNGVE